jgi:CDP-glucose 4,6-dehydratase
VFADIYRNKTVLVTGHTGFKGSWLCLWLKRLGAKVIGYALAPPTKPNHFDLLGLDIVSLIWDIRDKKKLIEAFESHKPEAVFHLAAQPLVRYSYLSPAETFETNVMGTVNVFEACRSISSVRAVVNVTSDKCYENKEEDYGYREMDPMGGYDTYSASKGCAELVTASYRRSFFNFADYGTKHNVLLSSARAGNVIGGGDWGDDRLIPDIVKAASRNEIVSIRSPKAIRPWQHVLEPLAGYLMLGQKLLEGRAEFADAWNLGPDEGSHVEVEKVVKGSKERWNRVEYELRGNENLHEAGLLKLDCTKARSVLGWKPVWDFERAMDITMRWYKEYYEDGKVLSTKDIEEYIASAGGSL